MLSLSRASAAPRGAGALAAGRSVGPVGRAGPARRAGLSVRSLPSTPVRPVFGPARGRWAGRFRSPISQWQLRAALPDDFVSMGVTESVCSGTEHFFYFSVSDFAFFTHVPSSYWLL